MRVNMTDMILDTLKQKLPALYPVNKSFRIEPLNYSENRVYRIEETDTLIKYILRVNRPGYHTREELEGEIRWMNELSEDTELLLPKVYRGINGEYIQSIVFPGKEPYTCILYSYLEGCPLEKLTGRQLLLQMKKLGRLLAVLHTQSQNRTNSYKIDRFSWGQEDLLGKNARWGDWRACPLLTEAQRKILEAAEAVIIQRLQAFGKSPDRFGLIHADVHTENLIIDRDKIQLIDFDDCGYGWYLYDFGCSLVKYTYITGLLKAMLEGYEEIRKLSPEERDELDTFLLLRRIVRVAWLTGHPDSDTAKKVEKEYLTETVRIAENYLFMKSTIFSNTE
jgi:Ser/Thr protein kinase RdoA (MazF antagonist)